ncbi:MAG: Crossover junction endodeoxyribonuclease RuvC [Candidatus Nomurabacteria bacterium GW2011_GWE1_32_28]|uniref:crossover junction endodeoxyribonuclease n=1 Tax=Candidatus Nomurabacteria bacterium GW2011_GWF1_31_48 TaxID=1618767 RepID=A0A0F9YV70_9BACT|nr:MAG: Crossover junction endodeoxyribonuclease RuvC [Candidatus Nomurabacteria bacterium GW2011_GWF2_30_133]KKP28783.1 MAG: Crossover junction endodeoxyribonuclease RuvC [Candidatus Nomurabacteria bacterium GW2011_GWE2_31_40]KKP30361.1 MAG: Crossover junction endodeoxyribonuclease RuvC [Candidatus Nomurabacteria bacterium GW2011_GWF1_31_48]KKP34888.1 MAG: Crossover junction endodeoxyribonuclease RuvC [Candidatus Nomurabacteria bacterium GW2011_GWE1_32_28]HAS80979.1 crossover junction endodeox
MIILGIDPGFERLGIAILEKNSGDKKEKVLFSKCFYTSAKLEFSERLVLIGKEVKSIIKEFKPDILSIETLFLTTNHKTVMHVAEARGVVIYEASCRGLKIFEASPPQIKIATTGYGKANKEQIMKMVKILVDINQNKTHPNNNSMVKESDDELDAIAIALTAFAYIKKM